MANERLRAAILSSGMGVQGVADHLGVDRKTVERWISGRKPYRKHQYELASALRVDVAYLWAEALSAEEINDLGQAEILTVYPHRSVVPDELFVRLFECATEHLDVLVYSGFWLSEDRKMQRLVAEKAAAGVQVRFLLGDPDCDDVARRGSDEGIGDAMAAKCRNALANYGKLPERDGVEFRLHGTILYNSIYRADGEMLVNPHIHGVGAYLAPVMHLRRVPGADLFSTYTESFDRVWAEARPVSGEDVGRVA